MLKRPNANRVDEEVSPSSLRSTQKWPKEEVNTHTKELKKKKRGGEGGELEGRGGYWGETKKKTRQKKTEGKNTQKTHHPTKALGSETN